MPRKVDMNKAFLFECCVFVVAVVTMVMCKWAFVARIVQEIYRTIEQEGEGEETLQIGVQINDPPPKIIITEAETMEEDDEVIEETESEFYTDEEDEGEIKALDPKYRNYY